MASPHPEAQLAQLVIWRVVVCVTDELSRLPAHGEGGTLLVIVDSPALCLSLRLIVIKKEASELGTWIKLALNFHIGNNAPELRSSKFQPCLTHLVAGSKYTIIMG